MWITPDRIVTDVFPFEWGNNLHRIYYVRDADTQLWHRAGSERTGGRKVLSAELFPHSQAYVGHRKKAAARPSVLQLFTLMPIGQHGQWERTTPKEEEREPEGVAMTLVETRQRVELQRQMADAYDIKGSRQFNAGDEEGADQSWDEAINLRVEANSMYRDDV